MSTINGLPTKTARLLAEMTNATCFDKAECLAWAFRPVSLETGASVRLVRVSLWVIRGWSTDDHLFDRAAARIMEAVGDRLFRSDAELRDAVYSVRHECRVGCEITEVDYDHPLGRKLPDDLRPDYDTFRAELEAEKARRQEEVYEKERKKEAKAAARRRPKEAKKLGVYLFEDGRYRITTACHSKDARWVDCTDGKRHLCCYGVCGTDALSSSGYLSIRSPCSSYATEEEAAAALAVIMCRD